ncbi:MAG: ABC transporter substrate-binding protein [Nocardioides sp.]|nr:ABC transporter substrate-binding protein [Nocardioides sp.]
MKLRLTALAVVAATALAASACGSDPTQSSASKAPTDTIVVGSAAFSENEILAEIYTQALQGAGVKVTKKLDIGAREAYIPALKTGEVDLIPEYTGNLLQFVDPKATATSAADVTAALPKALPSELEVLEPAAAEDKDSINVTKAFAQKNGLTSIADLKKIKGLRVAANPEFAQRPYGVPGLEKTYGISGIKFTAINDGGGPATVKALVDGKVDAADIYSTTPSIVDNGFVTLTDPSNLIAAQQVVPLINKKKASAKVTNTLNKVSADLTTQDLLQLNSKNQGKAKTAPAVLAKDWLTQKGLIK